MMNFISKTMFTENKMRDYVITLVNKWAKEKEMKISFLNSSEFLQASEETAKELRKMLKEDRENRIGKMQISE